MTLLQEVEPGFVKTSPQVPDTRRPSHQQVIAAIMAEARCSRSKAQETYQFLCLVRDTIRRYRTDVPDCEENLYHLSDRELARVHPVLDLIMPDNTTAAPGRAFALLNRRLLKGDELTFVHTKVGEVVVDCAVAIHINTAG